MPAVTLFILGVIAAAFVAYLLHRTASATLLERLSSDSRQLAKDQQEIQFLKDELVSERGRVGILNTELERMKTIVEKDRESFQQQVELLQSAEKRLKESFSSLAGEALKGNSAEFIQLAQATLGKQQAQAVGDLKLREQAVASLVEPISKTLVQLQEHVQSLETKREGAYGGITEQIQMLTGTQEQLKTETARLVTALRTPAQRGRWGEVQLKRVVELAGMVEYCDFKEQESYETEEGKLRPDMTVNLPNGRQIVVDSKVSLAAYLDATACDDETQRLLKLRDHAAQVKTHLVKLSSKAYWSQLSTTPEFVVAFLPGEVFFSAALQQDPSLIEFGAEQRVVLATPTTLIALLKAVAFGWRQEQLATNAQQISVLGGELYERLTSFTEHLVNVGKSLDSSVKAFNKSVGAMESRVMVTARKFRELGAAGGDEIEALEPIENVPREVSLRKASPIITTTEVRLKRIAAVAGDDGDYTSGK